MRTALMLCALLALASCQAANVKTSPDTSSSTGRASAPAKITSKVGDAVTLKGQKDGEQIRVTVVKVVYPAPPKDEFNTPEGGKVLAAVQIRIENTGTIAYTDAPGNGAKLYDASDQSYDQEIGNDTSAGPMLTSDLKLAPGDASVGYIDYVVASGTKLKKFQYTPDSGFAPDTGEWTLSA